MPVSIEVKSASAALNTVGQYAGGTYRLIPAPLMSISKNTQNTGGGIAIGSSLNIQLNGVLLATLGNPLPSNYTGGNTSADFLNTGWASTVGITDDHAAGITDAAHNDRLGIILAKQKALWTLFSGNLFPGVDVKDPRSRAPIKLLVEPLNGSEATWFICNLVDIAFEEGIWYEQCRYTISLTCDNYDGLDTSEQWHANLSSLSEEWSIQETEPTFYFGLLSQPGSEGLTDAYGSYTKKVWEITHSVSATGKRKVIDNGSEFSVTEGYQVASGVIYGPQSNMLASNSLHSLGNGVYTLPSGLSFGMIGSLDGGLDIDDSSLRNEYAIGLRGFSEQRNVMDGSMSVTETFVFGPRNTIRVGATETNALTIDTDIQSSIIRYSLQGSVKGINTLTYKDRESKAWPNASGYYYTYVEPYFRQRVLLLHGNNSATSRMNPLPLSKSISLNAVQGEINYNVSFDTRRTNLTQAIHEDIQVDDGLVGHHYGELPIIGRQNGDIIQYLNSNTNKTRSLTISLVVSGVYPNSVDITTGFRSLLLQKPSINPDYSTALSQIYNAFDPNLTGEAPRGAVIDPPQEHWNPLNGVYDYSVVWKWDSPSALNGIASNS